MEIFGVGILELLFIIVLMLVVLGPRDMVVTGRKLGHLIRRVVRSPIWAQLMDASREIREMPVKLAREAGIEEDVQELQRSLRGQYDPAKTIERELKDINAQINPSIPTGLPRNPYLKKDQPETDQNQAQDESSQGEGTPGEAPLSDADNAERRIDPRGSRPSSTDDLYRNIQ